MPPFLTSDTLTWADPFIALLLIAVFVTLLRVPPLTRRGHEPVSPACRRRVNAAVERRDGRVAVAEHRKAAQ